MLLKDNLIIKCINNNFNYLLIIIFKNLSFIIKNSNNYIKLILFVIQFN